MADDVRAKVPRLADAADILQWADRMEARFELPRLLRRLIRENNDQVVRVEMRSGEGTGARDTTELSKQPVQPHSFQMA